MDAFACIQARRRSRSFWICFLIVSFSAPIFAIDRDLRIDQLHHTGWTAKDGAPEGVRALAQTTDGFLWLGTATGLYRFDGVQFERYQLPEGQTFQRNNVVSLLAVPDGGLWIGFRLGGVSLLKNGTVTNYSEQDGIPPGTVRGFARDRHGIIWMAAMGGLARLEGSRWLRIGADWNFFGNGCTIFVDRQGTLWVSTLDSVLLLRDGTKKFQTAADHLKVVSWMVQSPDGTLWMAETGRSVRPLPLPSKAGSIQQPEIRVGSIAILFDDQGSLWITSVGDGLRRVRYPERLQSLHIAQFSHAADIFTHKDGLTGDYVNCILEDREGNIWIGTKLGLDRFRQSALVPIFFPSGTSEFTLAADQRGVTWASSADHGLFQIRNQNIVGTQSLYDLFPISPKSPISVETYHANAFWCFTHGRRNLIKVPKGLTEAITEDRWGRFWISIRQQGVMRWENGKWVSVESLGGPKDSSNAEFVDWQGRLWFGYADNTVAVMDGDNIRLLSHQNGILVGTVLAIYGYDSIMWIGGDHGLAFSNGSRFQPVVGPDGQAFSDIYGMVANADGLWLNENRGLIHITEAEIRRIQQDPRHRVNLEVFDSFDGLNAQPQRSRFRPSVIQGKDGRIWFATTQGLVGIDPNRRIPKNTLPPPVIIKSVMANNRSYVSSVSLKLPARTTAIQIAYTGLSLSIPERVRFRYKLEGFDSGWQSAGTRREAFYTNLSPGSYRFHVIACNNGGVWNETGASLDLIILPTFFQTNWFRALWAAFVTGLLWLVYQLRLKHLRGQLQLRLAERLSERERIARELHDTLLQSVQGLILSFQAATEQVPVSEPARQMLEHALDRSDQIIEEGRERVLNLRLSSSEGGELSPALAEVGEDLARIYPATFSVTTIRDVRELHPVVGDEVYRIGREAITNAFQHAQAKTIEADLAYNRAAFRLRIRDDGRGIDARILQDGYRFGHWGLPGMRERARKIGGDLQIRSRPGAGTEVDLRIPARTAYRISINSHRGHWLRRISSRMAHRQGLD